MTPLAAEASFAGVALSGSMLLAVPVAVLAGMVSFASPCVVPLVPGYLGFVSGMAGTGGTGKASRPRLVAGAMLFVLGFSAVFVTIGFLASSLGALLTEYVNVLARILGVIVILLGFAFMGAMPFLQTEKRVHVSPTAGLAGAPLLGAAFGLGWTPCIGPTLAAVFTLSLSEATQGRGIALAVAYCIGLGLPFVLLAALFERSGAVLRWLRRWRVPLMRTGGALLIVLGVLLVTGLWERLTGLLQGWIDGFWVAV